MLARIAETEEVVRDDGRYEEEWALLGRNLLCSIPGEALVRAAGGFVLALITGTFVARAWLIPLGSG